MSVTRKMLEHSSIYTIAQVFVMAGGLISFPIITRFLTKEQYGTMILVSLSVAIIEALSTVGLNHSALRFYSTYDRNNTTSVFASTIIIGSLIFGCAGALFGILLSKILTSFDIIHFDGMVIFYLAAFLVPIRVVTKIIGAIYRSGEHPWYFSAFSVANKYFGISVIIFFIVTLGLGLFGYYFALVLSEFLILVIIWLFFSRNIEISTKKFSFGVLKNFVTYGFPIVLASLAGFILSSSDRYMIGYFLNKADVAVYSVSYNLCTYMTGVLLTGFQFGFIPLIMKEWNLHAVDETHLQIQRVIRLYCIVSFPLFAGLCAMGQQVIVLLASEKYSRSFEILPYIAIASILNALSTPLMLGFWFQNKTKKIAVLMMYIAVLNLLMNSVLIPIAGLYGAAISTLFCYFTFIVVGSIRSSRYFKIKIPWFPVLIYGLCSFLMYLSITFFQSSYPNSHLLLQTTIGVLCYCGFVFVADRRFCRVTLFEFKRLLLRK